MTGFGSRPSDLRRAGEDFAASLSVVGGDRRWEARLPDGPCPGDWAALIARVGPGTLAGTLRLLAPEGGDAFDMKDGQKRHDVPEPLLWGVFSGGETCWWPPLADEPAEWFVVLCGNGVQQLNITTTEFLGHPRPGPRPLRT